MIDLRLIKPAAALVMAGAAIVACTVGQSAFAASTPAARPPAARTPAARMPTARIPAARTPAARTPTARMAAAPAGGTVSSGSRAAARPSWSGRLIRPAAEHIGDTQPGR